jgi:hypothetical protein
MICVVDLQSSFISPFGGAFLFLCSWESVYAKELSLFESISDEGDNWFGEDVMEKVIEFIIEHLPLSPHTAIVDIGCGNGVMMCEMVCNTSSSLRVEAFKFSFFSVLLF